MPVSEAATRRNCSASSSAAPQGRLKSGIYILVFRCDVQARIGRFMQQQRGEILVEISLTNNGLNAFPRRSSDRHWHAQLPGR